MTTKVAFATLITLTLCVAAGRAQPLDTGKLDRLLDRVAGKNKGMGSVTIAKDGRVAYTHSFGYSYVNAGDRKPATAATKYRIASITKMYTAVMIYPVKDIVSGLFDIYSNRPFDVPTFEAFAVSPEVLDQYVGTYSTPDAPLKWTITRRGNALYFQPPGNSAVPLEATTENKFTFAAGVSFEFDSAKGTLTIKGQGPFARVRDNN